MKTWILSGWVHFLIGFALCWVILKRPQWVKDLTAKIRAKIGL